MQDLVLVGAGGFARETSTLVCNINKIEPTFRQIAYVVDDEWYREGMEIRGIPVMSRNWLVNHKDDVVCCCAIGYPKERRSVQKSLMNEGMRFTNLIHPSAWIDAGSVVGTGCIIQTHSLIYVDCKLGDGVFLADYVTLGHDAVLEDYVTCFAKTQISGYVRIGEAACMGSLSFVIEKRRIGKDAVVAPGSIIFSNVKDGTYVMGNPAKRIEL